MFKKILFILVLCSLSIICDSFAGETKYDFECTPERADKSYVFMENTLPYYYTCLSDGTWNESEYWISDCFEYNNNEEVKDLIEKPAPSGFRMGGGNIWWKIYVNPNTPEIADEVYEYNSDANVMCNWVAPGRFVSLGYYTGSLNAYSTLEEAWCYYAKYVNVEDTNIEWDEQYNICKCTENGKQWDTTEHKCVTNTRDGVECTAARNGKKYYFSKSNELYLCEDGRWKEINDKYLSLCFLKDEITSPEQKFTKTGFKKVYSSDSRDCYTSMTEVVTGTGVYEYSEDRNDMCSWCGGMGNYIYNDGDDDLNLACNDNLDEAWCMFAQYHNAEKTSWDNGKCDCVDADGNADTSKEWDTTEHTCKPSSETQEESEDNNQQTCAEQFAGDDAATACCEKSELNPAETTFDKTTKACSCTDTTKEWDVDEKMCKNKEQAQEDPCTGKTGDELECCQVGSNKATWKDNKCRCVIAGNTIAETIYDIASSQCKCEDEEHKEWNATTNTCENKADVITEKEFKTAKEKVDNFFKKADENASVWKDASGKFNTARLASDLTAGVVLGTVGGVVSGVVIKKKQIEKGFEVLHCAVGGQSVADWGDTFTVGLNR